MFVFGQFRVCPTSLALYRGHTPIRLGSRAIRILLALIERQGEVMSSQELMALIWPDTIVEETNLRVNIFALRKALGDGGGGTYVQNVPGRGYRFAAGVETLGDADVPAARSWTVDPVIGQGALLERAAATLARDHFLSLVGPAGIGKTTIAMVLATAWAAEHKAEPVFVDLASVTVPSLVPMVAAAALGAPAGSGDMLRAIERSIAGRAALLILDNCEHVVDEAAQLASVLASASKDVFILSTSREALRFRGERIMRVPPLTYQENGAITLDQAEEYSAIQMFRHAAEIVDDQFELNDGNIATIASICRRLEGIPLAIELAAAQSNVLGAEAIAAELSRRFDLLSRGTRGVTRHRTLNDALRWSYDLLNPEQKAGLQAFAVFAGRFDLAAAQAMTEHLALSPDAMLEIICDLADKSLLTVHTERANHSYRLLETTRAYAAARSAEEGGWDRLRAIHARYLIRTLRDLFAAFSVEAIDLVGELVQDIRQAIDWAFGASGDVGLGVTLTAVASPFWMKLLEAGDNQYYLTRAREAIASGAATLDDPREEIFLEYGLALSIYCNRAVCPEMEAAFHRASDLARTTGDLTGEIKGCRLAYAVFGNDGAYRAELDAVERYRVLTEHNENGFTEFVYYRMMARSLHDLGRHVEARSFSLRALAAAPVSTTRLPRYDDAIDMWSVAKGTLARTLWVLGFPDQAREIADESVIDGLALDHSTSTSWTLAYNVCPIDFWRGETDRAAEHIALLRTQSHSIVEHRSDWANLYSDLLHAMRNGRTVMLDRAQIRTRRGQADIFATLPVALSREFILALDASEESWALPRDPAAARRAASVRSRLERQCRRGGFAWASPRRGDRPRGTELGVARRPGVVAVAQRTGMPGRSARRAGKNLSAILGRLRHA
jgi:predicted ATPase/DNA-binding winged helix-turn-helix (wHTH) protein